MNKMLKLEITEQDFDIGAEIEHLKRSSVGAIASFVGIVRDYQSGPELTSLTLEHYPGMTEHEIERIMQDARQRWSLVAVTVIHRVGRLAPQENIVFVGTASAHRKAAFESAHFIMDYLKTQAPFWKQEETTAGSQWVDARVEDDDALAKWTQS